MNTTSPIFLSHMNNQPLKLAPKSIKQYRRDSNSEMVEYPPELYDELLVFFDSKYY